MSNQFKVDIHKLTNFSVAETLDFIAAMHELERVANSIEFKRAILNHQFTETDGMTNLELYDFFMSGVDKFHLAADNDIDLSLTLYYSWRNTIGYTYPSTWLTWCNRKFFALMIDAEIAGHVVHENRHNAGFGHKNAGCLDSVPYGFGYIMRDLINGKVPPVRYVKKRVKRWWQFWR